MPKIWHFATNKNDVFDGSSKKGASMTRQMRRSQVRHLKKIKVIPTDMHLTAASGLGTILEIFDQSGCAEEFKGCLPERISHRSAGSYFLALMVMAGHIHGVDSLSDLSAIQDDPYLSKLFEDDVAAVRTIGDFLRDFEQEHVDKLNAFLNKMARSLHDSLAKALPEPFKPWARILDMDSTYHEHFGEKIEGVAWNYKNQWSIETQATFSSLGFSHGLQMRPGNTKSGTDAARMIDMLFSDSRTQEQRRREKLDYFRADSAYCYQDVIRACLRLGVLFTLTANDATTGWKEQMEKEGLDWQPWQWSQEEVDRAKKQGRELPRIEVSRFFWRPSWSEQTLLFPVVVKRTWQPVRPEKAQGSLFAPETIKEMGEWDYYAVVNNFDLSTWSLQGVLEHHAKRGNAENFIKEEKYNFKLKNFPCQSLLANHAWVLLAQVAHNMIRWIALMDAPDKPHYSKKIRNKYVFVAGRVVSHARSIVLRVMISAYERGLKKLREGWRFPAIVPAQFASAQSG
jgi:hypothetical protein